jgi:hypothetical protein
MLRIASTLIASVFLIATATAQSNAPKRVINPAAAKPKTLQLLDQRLPEAAFDDVPFEQVMDYLGGVTGMNMIVRWQTLEDAGVEKTKAITLKANNLRLSQVLWLVLGQAGGAEVKLAYRASGNVLILSTEEDLGKEMVLKVYDVSDLLVKPKNFYNAPTLDLSQQNLSSGGQGAGGGSGQSIFQNDDQDEDDEEERNRGDGAGVDDPETQRLIRLITETVEPDSWQLNGGLGTIVAWRNQLVIRNKILVHQQLGGLLREAD